MVNSLESQYPRAADFLREAEEGVIAHMAFPQVHWKRIHSTNVLERLHLEIRRRCNVIEIFPTAAADPRLIGAVLDEQGDEWLAVRRFSFAPAGKALDGLSCSIQRTP